MNYPIASSRSASPTHCGIGDVPVSQRVTVTRWTPRYAARPDCESPASVRRLRRVSGVMTVTGFPLGKSERMTVGEMFCEYASGAFANSPWGTPRGVACRRGADVSEFGGYGMKGFGHVELLGCDASLLAFHPPGDYEDRLAGFAVSEGGFHVKNHAC